MQTHEQEELLTKEVIRDSHELVLFNDDVNTFDHVIDCLVSICNHSTTQAEQCAYIVHYKGQCTVKKGSTEKLEPMLVALQMQELSAKIK
ncbi:MAG: ATP-dependent Clp protease adaptor ClpS [Vicingaceae bacterium]